MYKALSRGALCDGIAGCCLHAALAPLFNHEQGCNFKLHVKLMFMMLLIIQL